jgi:hypothetical protein
MNLSNLAWLVLIPSLVLAKEPKTDPFVEDFCAYLNARPITEAFLKITLGVSGAGAAVVGTEKTLIKLKEAKFASKEEAALAFLENQKKYYAKLAETTESFKFSPSANAKKWGVKQARFFFRNFVYEAEQHGLKQSQEAQDLSRFKTLREAEMIAGRPNNGTLGYKLTVDNFKLWVTQVDYGQDELKASDFFSSISKLYEEKAAEIRNTGVINLSEGTVMTESASEAAGLIKNNKGLGEVNHLTKTMRLSGLAAIGASSVLAAINIYFNFHEKNEKISEFIPNLKDEEATEITQWSHDEKLCRRELPKHGLLINMLKELKSRKKSNINDSDRNSYSGKNDKNESVILKKEINAHKQ